MVVVKSLLYICLALESDFSQDMGTAVGFGAYCQAHACAV